MKHWRRVGIALAGVIAVITLLPHTGSERVDAFGGEGRGFGVDFSNCTEFAGWGPVSLTQAKAIVPAGYALTTSGDGSAGIVVRATSCAGVKINGGESRPTNLSQIGINVVSPDGTGTINNYTFLYVSNNQDLVLHLLAAGLPAAFDPDLTYEFTYDATGKSGELYVTAAGWALPAYFLSGTEGDPPPDSEQPFLANWWYNGPLGIIRQSTNFPNIAFGSAAVTVYTSRDSALGRLIGGNHDGNYSILSVRGVYAAAHMDVSVSH